jgi:hypothetical protein
VRKNNANTLYSEGSFTTTSTSIADKLKILKNNKRIVMPEVSEGGKRNYFGIHGSSGANDISSEIFSS